MTTLRARPSLLTPWLLAGSLWLMTAWFFPFFPQLGSPNELSRLYLTRAIVDDGSFSLDGPISRYGAITDLATYKGRYYSDKAPGIGLSGVPVYVVAKALAGWNADAISTATLLRLLRIFLSGLPTAATVLLLFFLLGRLGLSENKVLFLSAAYGFGTIAFPYGVLLFGHQASALCLVGAFSLIERQGRNPGRLTPLAAGFCLGAALLFEYTTLLLVVPLALYAVISSPRRGRDTGMGIAGSIGPLLLLALYNWSCFSNPLSLGYAHLAQRSFAELHGRGLLGMVTPSFRRLGVIMASPTRGLLFFSPWLLLALPGLIIGIARPTSPRSRAACICIAAGTLFYLLFSMSLQLSAWGWSLGPRHLAPLIPFLVLAIGHLLQADFSPARWTARALLVLVPLSIVAVVLPTAVFGGFPPDFNNPLADFTLPLLISGCLSPSVGTSLGLTAAWAAVPFWISLTALVAWLFRLSKERRAVKLLSLLLALGLLVLIFTARGPADPLEMQALRWASRDVLRCNSH
ncbi:MAG TPA: hypothetical protein VM425_07930 [Myxococcota bacterium]|nr:hypothetical protein [Myxococcota bacterium]